MSPCAVELRCDPQPSRQFSWLPASNSAGGKVRNEDRGLTVMLASASNFLGITGIPGSALACVNVVKVDSIYHVH